MARVHVKMLLQLVHNHTQVHNLIIDAEVPGNSNTKSGNSYRLPSKTVWVDFITAM